MYNKAFVYFIALFLSLFSIFPNISLALNQEEYNSYAQNLANGGIITYSTDYKINQFITRREMLKVMINISKDSINQNCKQTFLDLPSSDWGCKYAQTALNLGYIANNQNFRPNDNVSKLEAIKMIFKAKKIEVSVSGNWQEAYYQKALELGIIQSFSDYNSNALRGFVFKTASNAILMDNQTSNLCASVITYAKSTSGECVEFPNSCIPQGYLKVDKCEEKINYTKNNLVLNFSNNMLENSVENNLKIYPKYKYSTTWQDAKTLSVTIEDSITKDNSVVLNVASGTLDSNNQKTNSIISKSFKITGDPIVESIYPNGKLTNVDNDLVVKFSKPVISLTNTSNQEKCPVVITPYFSGKCRWLTTSSFKYSFDESLPYGAKINVLVPSGFESISGQKTLNSKVVEITTPDFEVLSVHNPDNVEDNLKLIFNDKIDLESLKNNFKFSSKDNSNYNFSYEKDNLGNLNQTIVNILPKTGNWGYNSNYSFSINKNLTSKNGSIGLKNNYSSNFFINGLVGSYYVIKLRDENLSDLYNDNNFEYSQNNKIIYKNNPKVLIRFNKDFPLDKSYFSSNVDFDLNYVTYDYYDSKGNKSVLTNKSQIVLSFKSENISNLSLKILTSKLAQTNDETYNFSTKLNPKIISYKQINYKKACLTTNGEFDTTNSNLKSFKFDSFGSVNYFYEVSKYSQDADCAYKSGINTYVLTTTLNPNTNYNLEILNSFLDTSFYQISSNFKTSFTTPKALAEDKVVSILNSGDAILTPKYLKDLNVSISSQNLDQVYVNVCQGDFDLTLSNYLKNPECEGKTIKLNNLGFKPNISILSLQNIFGKTFDKDFVTIEVSKLKEDKTSYELNSYYSTSKSSYLFSNVAGVYKNSSNALLYLQDFASGTVLNDEISKVETYENNYGFGNYFGNTKKFQKNLAFQSVGSGVYKIEDTYIDGDILVTLKSGDLIYLPQIYKQKSQNSYFNYLSTSKPIYKPKEKVEISGVASFSNLIYNFINTNPVTITIYKDGNLLKTGEVTPNLFGKFDYNFSLDDNSIGNYSVVAGNNSIEFKVAEYQKPDFYIDLTSKKSFYNFDENANIEVDAKSYAGDMPLSGAKYSYNLTYNEFRFDGGKTTGYQFGEERGYFWDMPYFSQNSGTEAGGNDFLDNNGKLNLSLKMNNDTKIDKNYNLEISVTDSNSKKTISKSIGFTTTNYSEFLGIKTDKYFYNYKDKAKIDLVTTDVEGNKLPNRNFKLDIYKVSYTQTDYNLTSTQSLLTSENLSTSDNGLTSYNYEFLDYGEYKFVLTLANGYITTKSLYVSGENILLPNSTNNLLQLETDKQKYDIGDDLKLNISSPIIGVKALITVEKTNYILDYKTVDITDYNQEVDFKILKSYLPNAKIGVFLLKDTNYSTDKLTDLSQIRLQMQEIEQKLSDAKTDFPIILRDLTYNYDSNSNLDLTDLQKYSLLKTKEIEILNDILPSIYSGETSFNVNTDFVKLDTDITLDKTSYEPKDPQKITLTIKNNNSFVNGNVTLKIIDKSLLDLSDNSRDILDTLYHENPVGISFNTNLSNIIKRLDFVSKTSELTTGNQLPVMEKGLGGVSYATDAAAPEAPTSDAGDLDLSNIFGGAPSQANTQVIVRQDFRDLAYYTANLEVKNGKATLDISSLPDNVTTWEIYGFANTKDLEVGSFKKEFQVKKDFMIVSNFPNFVTLGDEVQLGAIFINNTSSKQVFDLSIESEIFDFENATGSLEIDANSQKYFSFKAKTKDLKDISTLVGNITLKASNSILSDGIMKSISLYYPSTKEYVYTNGNTKDVSYEENLDFINTLQTHDLNLDISVGATIFTGLKEKIKDIINYPYDDLYSRFVVIKTIENLKNIYTKIGKISDYNQIKVVDYYDKKTYSLDELYDYLTKDVKNYMIGEDSFMYYKNCKISYNFDCESIDLSKKYLELGLKIDGIDSVKILNKYEKYLLTQKQNPDFVDNIKNYIGISKQNDKDFILKYFDFDISKLNDSEKLDYINVFLNVGINNENTKKLYNQLKNNLILEARTGFLPSFDNLSSTSQLLEIMLKNSESDEFLLQNLTRFISNNMFSQNRYYYFDSNDSLEAIYQYLDKKEDLKNTNFDYEVYFNNNILSSGSFNQENKFELQTKNYDLKSITGDLKDNKIGFSKTNSQNMYYDVGVGYYVDAKNIESKDNGIVVGKKYYSYNDYLNSNVKKCYSFWWFSNCYYEKTKNIDEITTASRGDLVIGEITLTLDKPVNNLVLNDYIPAGFEVLNTDFNTVGKSVKELEDNYFNWYNLKQIKYDGVYLYANSLNQGTYTFKYVMQANSSGKFGVKPTFAQDLKTPEIWGRSQGFEFDVN